MHRSRLRRTYKTTRRHSSSQILYRTIDWRFGLVVNALVSIDEVTLHPARLVLGWVTVPRFHLPVPKNLSQCITSHSGQLSLAIPP